MRLLLRFWQALAIWSGILVVILLVISLATGQSAAQVLAYLPAWAGLAFALAAFPAGIWVSSEAFPNGLLVLRRIVDVGVAVLSVSAVMFVLGNSIAPVANRWLSATEGPCQFRTNTTCCLSAFTTLES